MNIKRMMVLTLVWVLAAGWMFCTYGEDELRTVVILQTTDIHGCMGAGDDKPGFPRQAALIRQERARAEQAGHGVLVIDCGDVTQGSLPVSFDHGAGMMKALNTAGYDVWVPGNHDFDYGTNTLRKNAELFHGKRLAANVRLTQAPGLFERWTMLTRNGVRIAVIGLTADYLRQWIAPAQLSGVEESSAEQALDEIMPEIMKESPDLIVLADHCGEFSSGRLHKDGKRKSIAEITKKYPQIALIAGGHSHQSVAGKKIYPKTWFVQAAALSEGVIKATAICNLSKHRVESMESVMLSPDANTPEDTETVKVLEDVRQQARESGRVAVGWTSKDLEPVKNRERNALAELFGRAIRAKTGAALAVHGTLSKYRVKTGRITGRQVFMLAPYENYITVLSLNAAQIKRIIEEQHTGVKPGSYMEVHGVKYHLTGKGKVDGELILEQTGKEWKEDDPALETAFGSFAVSGAGGRYPELKKIAEDKEVRRRDTDSTVREALEEYLKSCGKGK